MALLSLTTEHPTGMKVAMASKPTAEEKLLASLLSTERAGARRAIESITPPPASRQTRYACRVCRDTKRVKVPRDIGCTQPCAACSDG